MVPVLQYIDILLLMCITLVIAMSVAVSVRSADEIVHELDELAGDLGRSDAHVIRNAIGECLQEYAEYLLAPERFGDEEDEIISSEEMWVYLFYESETVAEYTDKIR